MKQHKERKKERKKETKKEMFFLRLRLIWNLIFVLNIDPTYLNSIINTLNPTVRNLK